MILDLFAGPGGWDVGARELGLDVIGIELDGAACATRTAAGLATMAADVSKIDPVPLTAEHGPITGLLGSPPCPSFSAAGRRAGLDELPRLHRHLHGCLGKWNDPGDDWSDARTPLVLEPARFVNMLTPQWIALEQVPTVLPIWETMARLFEAWGYSTWTGLLNSADYGVPQTRIRAFLLAHRAWAAQPPTPTHSREGDDGNLFGSQLLPWVTMADALGWEGEDRPARTLCGRGTPRWLYEDDSGNRGKMVLNPGRTPTQPNRRTYELDEPAPTIAFGHDRANWAWERPATTVCGDPRIGRPGHKDRDKGEKQFEQDSVRLTIEEALTLQSFPVDYPLQGSMTAKFGQVGNAVPPLLAKAILVGLLHL